jgi:hypothetical protein
MNYGNKMATTALVEQLKQARQSYATSVYESGNSGGLDMRAVMANPAGFRQWASGLDAARASGAYNGWADSQLGSALAATQSSGGGMNTVSGIMNQAGAQVAELVAQDIVNAVTQRAASYTGQGRSVGQRLLP